MVRFLVFELENTLIKTTGDVFSNAREALRVFQGFKTDRGDNLPLCLLSADSTSWSGAGTGPFDRLVSRLETLGLRNFFDPVGQRVTIGLEAGAQIVDKRLFEVVLLRSQAGARLDNGVFVSGMEDAVRAARTMNIRTFQFSPEQTGNGDSFSDWTEAPLLVANLFEVAKMKNREVAVRFHLSARENLDVTSLRPTTRADTLEGTVNSWEPISSETFKELDGVNVKLPVKITVELDLSGRIRSLEQTRPLPEDQEEAKHFLESLVRHGQVATEDGPGLDTATHEISTDRQGKRYLVRKRFSAV